MLRLAMVLSAGLFVILVGLWALGHLLYRTQMAEAEVIWRSLAKGSPEATFDPEALIGHPEIARRYLTHAIAPGTPLSPRVTLTMTGTFRLGDAANPRPMPMTARQRLAAPDAFVWITEIGTAPLTITGSDGFDGEKGWTRFWMLRALPLVRAADTPDINRSALARPALEAVWAPAALHPALGAVWTQTGPDSADVTFSSGPEPVTISLTLSQDGAVETVTTRRWSNANPEKRFQWQPFGGRAFGESTFGGYTIPSRMEAGNHFGTPAYFAFFVVEITSAAYAD